MKRLIADIAISAFTTLFVLFVFGGGSAGSGGGITAGAIIFALVLVLLAPLLLLAGLAFGGFLAAKAIKYRRPGFIAGPLLVVTVIPLAASYHLHRDTQAIEALVVKPFVTPSSPHQLVVIDGPTSKCDTLCRQILASGRFEVVRGDIHYQLVTGDGCLSTITLADSALEFAEAGYSELCASEINARSLSPALRVVIRRVDDRAPYEPMPGNFRGDIGELYEVGATGERLLGRWIGGTVESHVPSALLFLGRLVGMRFEKYVGTGFAQADFYGAALGLPLSRDGHPGQSSDRALMERVVRLVPLVSDKEKALRLQANLARRLGPDIAGPLMLQMLRSDSPTAIDRGIRMLTGLPAEVQRAAIPDLLSIARGDDLALAKTAINALGRLPAEDFMGLKDQIVGLIQSPSEPIAGAALSAVANSQAPDCGFLGAELTDLAFNARLEDEDSPILYPLMKAMDCLPQPFAPETQERARQRFTDNPALSRGEMWMMIRIMSYRSPNGHDDAYAMIAALPSPRFEEAVEAVVTENQPAMVFATNKIWKDEQLQYLVERTEQVPAAQLRKYVESIFDQTSRHEFKPIKPRLSEILKARLARAAGSNDRTAQRQIEGVMRRFHLTGPASAT